MGSEDDTLEKPHVMKFAALFALLFANIVTTGARYSLSFTIYPDLGPDLGITGVQYGVLSGLGFSIVFMLCLIPWGRAADVDWIGRRTVILFGLVLQLIFCSMQAAAWDFWSLLFIRFGLAAGQAAITAPSLAIIAQLFYYDGGISMANSVFNMGTYVGSGLASLAGLLSFIYGWQASFGL